MSTPKPNEPARTVLITASKFSLRLLASLSAINAPTKPLITPPMAGSMPIAIAKAKPGKTEWEIKLTCNSLLCVINTVPTAGQSIPVKTEIISGINNQLSKGRDINQRKH